MPPSVLRLGGLLVCVEQVHENTDARAATEGKAIVTSLFHLRQCIHALSAGRRPNYRSSKLTRLL